MVETKKFSAFLRQVHHGQSDWFVVNRDGLQLGRHNGHTRCYPFVDSQGTAISNRIQVVCNRFLFTGAHNDQCCSTRDGKCGDHDRRRDRQKLGAQAQNQFYSCVPSRLSKRARLSGNP